MKKKILAFLLVAMFIVTGAIFVGCGSSADNRTTFLEMERAVGSFTSSDSIFEQGTAGGIQTNFYIKNFKHKNDSNVLVDDDDNYQVVNAVCLNYIYNYYGELDNLPNKYNFGPLYDNVVKLRTKYQEMKVLGNELQSLGNNAKTFVYNSYFSKYKTSAREFIKQAYLTATSLGDLLINNAKITSSLGTSEQTGEILNKYLDYQCLMVFGDYADLFMSSCEGQVVNQNIYNTADLYMTHYCNNVMTHTNKELTIDVANELIRMSNALNAERRLFKIAVNEFSLYDYTTKYEQSIEAYEKDKSDADSYFDEIERYLKDTNCAHRIYYNYLVNNIKN